MITNDINSVSHSSQDEHTQVSASNKSDSKQSSNKPLTMPTSKPTSSTVCNELILMMDEMRSNMTKRLQELKEEEIMPIAEYISKISTMVYTNEESLQKIKSNLDVVTQTVSKLDTKLTMQKEIYSIQQKDINICISDIASHNQKQQSHSLSV
eukprot:15359277-Ditylum_brightwellii.AAC.1